MAKVSIATVLVLGVGVVVTHGQLSGLSGQSPPQNGGQMGGPQQDDLKGTIHSMLSGRMSDAIQGAQNGHTSASAYSEPLVGARPWVGWYDPEEPGEQEICMRSFRRCIAYFDGERLRYPHNDRIAPYIH